MSYEETSVELDAAISSLIRAGELGIVVVDIKGIVLQAAGSLADWATVGQPVEQNAPWLTGLGDRLAAIAVNAAPALRLEHVSVLDHRGVPDRVVSLNAIPGDSPGRTLIALRDATDTALLQREVLQQRNALSLAHAELQAARDAADAASHAKSDFLAKVNHELRTPLHVVLGNAEMLADEASTLEPADRRILASDLLSEGQYLLGLIDDLLDLSRAEAGAPLLEIEEFALAPLLEECVAAVSAHAYAAEVDIQLDLADAPLEVVADRRAIRQITVNLLSNAAKFSPIGGLVICKAEATPDGFEISVRDSGPGLSPDQVAEAISPFGQVNNQRNSRARRGSGVGLSLVKALTEAHGGALELITALGEGLKAVARLPNP